MLVTVFRVCCTAIGVKLALTLLVLVAIVKFEPFIYDINLYFLLHVKFKIENLRSMYITGGS